MASKTPKPNDGHDEITWYACGEMVPGSMLGGPELGNICLEHIRQTIPNLVPTTYERANAYLRKQLKKPTDKRDLLREMCMMIPLNLPKDRKAYFKSDTMKRLLPLINGSAIVYPTTDLPPDSFGTWESIGSLNHQLEKLVFDPQAHEPQRGIVLLAYFTKVGVDVKPSEIKEHQIDDLPFA